MFPTAKSYKAALVLLCVITVSLISVFTEPDVALTQFGSPISTPTSTPDPTKNNPMVLFYADAFKLDYDEAERRLDLQARMSVVEQKLMEDEAYFASWMQHEPEFGLVVSFTTADGEERIRKYLADVDWADLVTVVQSDMTRQEIADLREKVVAEARKTGIQFGSGINYPEGKARLYTEQSDELRMELEANSEIAPIIDKIEFIQEAGGDAPAVQPDEDSYHPKQETEAQPLVETGPLQIRNLWLKVASIVALIVAFGIILKQV